MEETSVMLSFGTSINHKCTTATAGTFHGPSDTLYEQQQCCLVAARETWAAQIGAPYDQVNYACKVPSNRSSQQLWAVCLF